MNEHRQNSSQRNYLSKICSKTHNFILKSNSRNTNWMVDHFTQVKAAQDIKCQCQNRLKSYKTFYETIINT